MANGNGMKSRNVFFTSILGICAAILPAHAADFKTVASTGYVDHFVNQREIAANRVTATENLDAVLSSTEKYPSMATANAMITSAVAAAGPALTAGDNITIENGVISATDTNTTYSTGTASVAGLTKLYTTTGTNTNGTMTQNAITNALAGKAATADLTELSNLIVAGNETVPSTIGETQNVTTVIGAINALNAKTSSMATDASFSEFNTRMTNAETAIGEINAALPEKENVSHRVTDTVGFNDYLGESNDGTVYYPSMDVTMAMIDDALGTYSGTHSGGDETHPVWIDGNGEPQEITSYDGNAATATLATTAETANSVAWSGVTDKPTLHGKNLTGNVTLSASDVGAVAATGQTAGGILTTNASGVVGVSATIPATQVTGLNSALTDKQDKLTSTNVTSSGSGVVKSVVADNGTITVTKNTVGNADIAADANIDLSKINGAEAAANRVTDTDGFNDYLGESNDGTVYYPSMDVAQAMIESGIAEIDLVKIDETVADDANTVMVRNDTGTYVPAISSDVSVTTDNDIGTTLTVNHAERADKIPFGSENSTNYASIWVE